MRYLLLALLLSCETQKDNEEYRSADKTASGFHVIYHDAGLLASGLTTYEQVKAAFDTAFLRSALSLNARFGLTVEQIYTVPHDERIVFVLVDHYRFSIGSDSFAAGEYREGRIAVAMHPKSHVESGIATPPDALPWTLVTGPITGRTYFGRLDLVAAFPALEHELGHHFFGPGFEH